MTRQAIDPANLPGGPGDCASDAPAADPSTCSLNLSKPGDLALVLRAVTNGWAVPDHVRVQIIEQLEPAMKAYQAAGTPRAQARVLKIVKLVLRMDAWNLIAEGVPKSKLPYLRRRYPEKRRPRPRSKAEVQRRAKREDRALERLLSKTLLSRS